MNKLNNDNRRVQLNITAKKLQLTKSRLCIVQH